MSWGVPRRFMHPHCHNVAIGPPMDFGDLDIVRDTGLLTGTDVRLSLSNHHGGLLKQPTVIMIHFTTSIGKAREVIREMDVQQVSSHLVVDRGGEFWQAVPLNRVARHAGIGSWGGYQNNINENAIGIEVNNLGPLWLTEDNRFIDSYGKERTDRDLEPLAHRNARSVNLKEVWKTTNPNTYDMLIKKGVSSEKLNLFCYWEIYPEAQQRALQRICSLLLTRFPTIRAIIGHDDYAPLRKFDPGPSLRMEKLLGWMPAARTILPAHDLRHPGYTESQDPPDYMRNLVTSRTFGGGVPGRDIE